MCLQRYVWWKKSVDNWTKDHPFPIDIDYMISDTLELLRPKMRLCCSMDEAAKLVSDLEREVLIKLGEEETLCLYTFLNYLCVCVCYAAGSSSPVAAGPFHRFSSIPVVGGSVSCTDVFLCVCVILSCFSSLGSVNFS